LTVWVIIGQLQTPCRRGRFAQCITEYGDELRQESFANDPLACFGQRFEAAFTLLSRGSVKRIAFTRETQPGSVERQVHIFRKPLDDPEHFGKRGAALEDQSCGRVGQCEEALECPADPEVLLEHFGGQSATGAGNHEQVSPVGGW
jgi:hypothetical protein